MQTRLISGVVKKFIKPFWLISFLAIFICFMVVYALLAEEVVFYYNETSGRITSISKQNFFFGGLGLIVTTNLILYVFSKLIRVSYKAEETFLDSLADWFIFLGGILNGFFVLSSVFILLFNRLEYFDPRPLGILLYLMVFVIIFWMIRLILLILRR